MAELKLEGGNRVITGAALAKSVTQLQLVRCSGVLLKGIKRTGLTTLIDYAPPVVRIQDCDLTRAAAGATIINGRYSGWKRMEVDNCRFGFSDHDMLHTAPGFDAAAQAVIPLTGWVRNTTFEGLTEGADHPHADAVQIAYGSQDFLWEDCVFRNVRSSFQITPLQNHNPLTDGGQSTGFGAHRHMMLHRVILDNAGAARFFCCPDLELDTVIQTGAGTVDLRYDQVIVKVPGQPYRAKQPLDEKTQRVKMRHCQIAKFVLDDRVTFDAAACYGNKIKLIVGVDGKTPLPAKTEKKIRAILEKTMPVDDPCADLKTELAAAQARVTDLSAQRDSIIKERDELDATVAATLAALRS